MASARYFFCASHVVAFDFRRRVIIFFRCVGALLFFSVASARYYVFPLRRRRALISPHRSSAFAPAWCAARVAPSDRPTGGGGGGGCDEQERSSTFGGSSSGGAAAGVCRRRRRATRLMAAAVVVVAAAVQRGAKAPGRCGVAVEGTSVWERVVGVGGKGGVGARRRCESASSV